MSDNMDWLDENPAVPCKAHPGMVSYPDQGIPCTDCEDGIPSVKPKPDEVEQLARLDAYITRNLEPSVSPPPLMSQDVASKIVTNAIAEIKRLQRDYITACDELYATEGKLLKYTNVDLE